ncbi:MAG: hypothetical protein GY757_45790 [bacterium]|nr:hypothetical protein [bacterium]
MGGPAASIIIPAPLGEEAKAGIRADIQRMAKHIEGDNFWIEDTPLFFCIGPEFEGDEPLEDYIAEGVPGIIGWTPRDNLDLISLCKSKRDHRVLGELCLYFARKLNGLIDFNGALTPPIRGKVKTLFHERYSGSGNNWEDWEPHFNEMVRGMPGRLFSIPYVTITGMTWVSHIGDAEFMVSWLQHPNFHLIK